MKRLIMVKMNGFEKSGEDGVLQQLRYPDGIISERFVCKELSTNWFEAPHDYFDTRGFEPCVIDVEVNDAAEWDKSLLVGE